MASKRFNENFNILTIFLTLFMNEIKALNNMKFSKKKKMNFRNIKKSFTFTFLSHN